jgi:hypothetical protein
VKKHAWAPLPWFHSRCGLDAPGTSPQEPQERHMEATRSLP